MTNRRTSHFDRVASTWDENPRRIVLAQQVLQAIQAALPFEPHWKALEIGCGTGLLSVPVAEKVAALAAVDTSEGMIEVLEEKIRKHRISNIEPVFSNIFHTSSALTPPEHFDLVYSSMTFHHIGDTMPALKKLATLLRTGGYLAIADLDEEDGFFHDDENEEVHHGFNRDLFRQLLTASGFREIRFSTAASVQKVNRAGEEKNYTVFLAVAKK